VVILDGNNALYNSTPVSVKWQTLCFRVNNLVCKTLNCFVCCLDGDGFKFLCLQHGPISLANTFYHQCCNLHVTRTDFFLILPSYGEEFQFSWNPFCFGCWSHNIRWMCGELQQSQPISRWYPVASHSRLPFSFPRPLDAKIAFNQAPDGKDHSSNCCAC